MKYVVWNTLSNNEKTAILKRPISEKNAMIDKKVIDIIKTVKSKGDKAIYDYTKEFDNVNLTSLQVSVEEYNFAEKSLSEKEKTAIIFAKEQIERNHQNQFPVNKKIETCPGVYCERQSRAIEKVGLYVPGGTAPLVSSVLMQAVPARIAQSPLRILCTPPDRQGKIDPRLIFAAKICEITKIYKIGGAQAIAVMAYGTETIPKVDKIFGPGNPWVTQAKLNVARDPQGASIDMPAGPSEVLVIADEMANPAYVAADLLSQAEHGCDSQVILITLTDNMAQKIGKEIEAQLSNLTRKFIAELALKNSLLITANDLEEAINISNQYAPEHLILQVDNPERYVASIKNAGAVFLGPWSPETVGDYVTGSNHVLPTSGYARSYSGLSVMDFMKFISIQQVSKEGLKRIAPYAETLAEIEGLDAHKNAVTLRISEEIYECDRVNS